MEGNEREGTQRGRGMRNADDMENAVHMYIFNAKNNRSSKDRKNLNVFLRHCFSIR
jgi:hypothetical protein